MATKEPPKPGGMKGGIRRPRGPRGTWSYVVTLPMPAGNSMNAQRCTACGQREWLGAERLEACPKCGEAMRDTREPRQLTEGGFTTRHDAEIARAKIVQRLGMGNYAPPERMTLAAYLRDRWLPAVRASGLKRTTREGYERHVQRHIIGPTAQPFPIGLVELRRLNMQIIRDHYRDLMQGYMVEDVLRKKHSRPIIDEATKQPKRGLVRKPGLSLATVKRVQAALHGALRDAVELGMLDRNPATGAVAKKKLGDGDEVPRELPAWSADELQRFLSSQEGGPLYPLWRLFALTGMRRGEVVGLQWGDVDLEGARVTVRRTRVPVKGGEIVETASKTHQVRVVEIDPDTAAVLREMRDARKVRPLDHRTSYVFTNDEGEPLGPNSVSYRFRKAQEDAGLRHIPLHGLRHTHISQLVAEGQSIPMVAARAGHANPNVTLGTYSHYLPGQQQTAVTSMAKYTRKNGK